ncbi:MAG: helix-turn-helix transcriptional regulator [Haloferacaceae archaeon]
MVAVAGGRWHALVAGGRWHALGVVDAWADLRVAAVGPFDAVGTAVGTALVVGLALLVAHLAFGTFRRPSVSVVRDEPPSVLSDRDRLLLLVERHDGRMRQQEIVAQVEWSKAKVSRLLSDLEEEGVLRKIRLGRENLICLESHDPFGRN